MLALQVLGSIRNYFKELSNTPKTTLIIISVILGTVLFFILPIAFLILAIGLFINRKAEKKRLLGFPLLAIFLAIACGYALVEIYVSFVTIFKPIVSEVRMLDMINWFTVKELSTLDNIGRFGVVLGSVIGLLTPKFLISNVKKDKSGPGLVRGEKIVKGGWATLKDIEDKFSFEYPKKGVDIGIPLGELQDKLVSINPNKGKIKIAGHVLMVGATGTGKSFTYIRNQIIASAAAGHSIVITDPKGELFQDMAKWLEQEEYNVIPFNVIDPAHSFWWNMLEECKDPDEVIDLAEWLINSAGDDHAFFTGGEKNALAAVIGFAKYMLPDEQKHMRAVLSILSWGQQELDIRMKNAFAKAELPQDIYEMWASCQLHYENYREGIKNKLRPITKGALSALTSRSDFSLDTVGKEKTALFLILPAEEGDLQPLLVPFYTFMFRRLNELVARQKSGKLPIPVRFIMDEFANIGKVPDIDKVCATGRSKGITVQIAIQNIGQLKGLYKENNAWEAVVGNCPTKLCFSVGDTSSAEFFTEMITKAEIEHITESKDLRKIFEPRGRKMVTKTVPLIEPAEIRQLPINDSIAIVREKKPLYIQKAPWVDMPQYEEIVKAGEVMPKDYIPAKSLEVDTPVSSIIQQPNSSEVVTNEESNTKNEEFGNR